MEEGACSLGQTLVRCVHLKKDKLGIDTHKESVYMYHINVCRCSCRFPCLCVCILVGESHLSVNVFHFSLSIGGSLKLINAPPPCQYDCHLCEVFKPNDFHDQHMLNPHMHVNSYRLTHTTTAITVHANTPWENLETLPDITHCVQLTVRDRRRVFLKL